MSQATPQRLLDFHRDAFQSLWTNHGLLVLARGLGIRHILRAFLNLLCNGHGRPKESLVFLLNTTREAVEDISMELRSEGVPTSRLPRILEGETLAKEREAVYKSGGPLLLDIHSLSYLIGVLFVTSRVLVVDFLAKRVPPGRVAGILVSHAERVAYEGNDAFAIRLFREQNPDGFVKAFTEAPVQLLGKHEHKLGRALTALGVHTVCLYPRFHVAVSETLAKRQPDAIELSQPMTEEMDTMQAALMELMEENLAELRRNKRVNPDDCTMANALQPSFEMSIARQLGDQTECLRNIARFRQLMIRLVQHDCVAFWRSIDGLHAGEGDAWLLSAVGDRFYTAARRRVHILGKRDEEEGESKRRKQEDVFTIGRVTYTPVLQASPKWTLLLEILDEIRTVWESPGVNKFGGVLVAVRDQRTADQLASVLAVGPRAVLMRSYAFYMMSKMAGGDRGRGRGRGRGSVPIAVNIEIPDALAKTLVSMQGDPAVALRDATAVTPHPIVIHPDPSRVLYALRPSFVVIYDPEPGLVRELEVFKAMHPGLPLRVYFVTHAGSIEEERYAAAIRSEQNAFESLIKQKAALVMAPDPHRVRSGGRTIVVDTREFRCTLPSHVYNLGIGIQPVQLEVGDYVLSPDVCVERKSFPDLVQSLASGRLLRQAENMCRYYTRPLLLIEYDEAAGHSMRPGLSTAPVYGDRRVVSKLAILLQRFPRLKVVWSESPRASAAIFDRIKKRESSEPDPVIAAAIGEETSGTGAGVGGGGSFEDEFTPIPPDMLRQIPGVAQGNILGVMRSVEAQGGLKALIGMSDIRLAELLGSDSATAKFKDFVDFDARGAEKEEEERERNFVEC